MIKLFNAVEDVFIKIHDATSPWLLTTLARFLFAALLLSYYWKSAGTKFDGIFTPSLGAYAQIFPRAMEAAGYDPSQLSFIHTFIALAGSYAEVILPALLLFGLLTRLAALGMIGFVIVQSIVDVVGHGLVSKDVGRWFDSVPGSLILDQRALWIFLLVIIVLKGAGPFSVDRFLVRGSG